MTTQQIEQRANDMLQALTAQRNAALDQTVQLHAELMAARREIEALRAKAAEQSAPASA